MFTNIEMCGLRFYSLLFYDLRDLVNKWYGKIKLIEI